MPNEFNRDVSMLHQEIGELKSRLMSLSEDIVDLKQSNRLLLEFMYKTQGGKAWLLGLFLVAGSVGAFINNTAQFLLGKH